MLFTVTALFVPTAASANSPVAVVVILSPATAPLTFTVSVASFFPSYVLLAAVMLSIVSVFFATVSVADFSPAAYLPATFAAFAVIVVSPAPLIVTAPVAGSISATFVLLLDHVIAP